MKKLFFLSTILFSTIFFGQDKSDSKKIFDLSDKFKNAETKKQRDSILNEMISLKDGLTSGLEKKMAVKLIDISKELSELKDNYIPANDLNILTKEDLKKFKIESDKFSGITTIRPDFVYSNPTIRIRLDWNDSKIALYLISSYEGSDWLFMNNAIILVDGQKFQYQIKSGERNVNVGYVTEYSTDIVNENMMNLVNAIANSKEQIDVRFSGSKGEKDFKLPLKTKERFVGMLNIYNKLKK